jgi:hypothetical protein
MKKLALIASFIVAVALSLQFGLPGAALAARKKVDCAKAMEELGGGKKVAEVAKDLKISRSSVYRCRRMAKKKAKAEASPAATPGASKK